MLSQLSYTPKNGCLIMVGLGRFELPTSRLSGVRSNQLSYRPNKPATELSPAFGKRIACVSENNFALP